MPSMGQPKDLGEPLFESIRLDTKLTSRYLLDQYIETYWVPLTEYKGRPSFSATASAVKVLPTPGGPLYQGLEAELKKKPGYILQKCNDSLSLPFDDVVKLLVRFRPQPGFCDGHDNIFLFRWKS